MRSRAAAQVQYDKAVQMCSYAVGDRVLIYNTPGETEAGRKTPRPVDQTLSHYGAAFGGWVLCGERIGRQVSTRPRQPFKGGTGRPGS
jgi:hypothetical protein